MSNWVEVARVVEFESTDRKLVDLGGNQQIVLVKLPDGFFAVSAWCSHQRASLLQGEISDHEIECPLHGARFDLRTGKQLCLPAVRPISNYPVKVENEQIFLQV